MINSNEKDDKMVKIDGKHHSIEGISSPSKSESPVKSKKQTGNQTPNNKKGLLL
jgi:hypothetical protein